MLHDGKSMGGCTDAVQAMDGIAVSGGRKLEEPNIWGIQAIMNNTSYSICNQLFYCFLM